LVVSLNYQQETEIIINSRDIIWLNQVHKEWILNKPNKQPNYDDDDGVEGMIQSVNTSQNTPEEVKDRDELKRIKVYKQMRWESSFNPDAMQVV
jgi:soluble lytic murein transglycosylase-like protein